MRKQRLAGLVGEIDEDCPGLHQANAIFAVDDRRNAIVGADFQKFRMNCSSVPMSIRCTV
jgi:hypothetical protein